MFDVLERMRTLTVPVGADIGYVAERDVLGLGADIVVTGRPAPHTAK